MRKVKPITDPAYQGRSLWKTIRQVKPAGKSTPCLQIRRVMRRPPRPWKDAAQLGNHQSAGNEPAKDVSRSPGCKLLHGMRNCSTTAWPTSANCANQILSQRAESWRRAPSFNGVHVACCPVGTHDVPAGHDHSTGFSYTNALRSQHAQSNRGTYVYSTVYELFALACILVCWPGFVLLARQFVCRCCCVDP